MNDMKKIEIMEEATDRLYEKLDELNGKSGQMSDSCAELYDVLMDGINCGETTLAMKGGGESEYSGRGMGGDGGSYDGSFDGGTYRRKRNSMGRFSRDGGQSGYSRHDTGGLKRKLEELKEASPEEYDRLISQLEG